MEALKNKPLSELLVNIKDPNEEEEGGEEEEAAVPAVSMQVSAENLL